MANRYLIFVLTFLVATTYSCLSAKIITVSCFEHERLALLEFKHSVQDYFDMLSSWVGDDCCRWEGIRCDGVTGNVVSINLRGIRQTYSTSGWYYGLRDEYDRFGNDYYLISNEVSSSLAELMHLKYLDLSGNDFCLSRIPEFIGSLRQLSYLNLSNGEFRGNIPLHIGNLSNLKVLDLSPPDAGAVKADDMAWISGLSSLEHLDLSSVDLSDAKNRHMVFNVIPSLQYLSLSGCGLSNADLGPFLNSSTILPNIQHLDLGYNSFEGKLPSIFQNFTSLSSLDLSHFNLSRVSWNFANLLNMIPSLSELYMPSCGLDNTHISPYHHNLSALSNIKSLDLSHNSIEGKFPMVLTNMSSLRTLELSGNMLNSSIPNMPNLLSLDVSNNKFKHIKEVGIWRLCCYLKQLHLSDNHFDIEKIDAPKNVSQCSHYALERLFLSRNFNGTIPGSLGRLTNLRTLDLSSSGLRGPIPKSLGKLGLLEVLKLSYNQLTGPLPTFIGKLINLDLSSNQLNGSIPESWGRLAALTNLNIDNNRLTGPIPTSLGRLVSLQAFSASSNLLTGAIPVSLGQLTKLQLLDISNNSLEGVAFEAHFSKLLMLKHLDTSSNTKLTFNVSRGWMPPFQLITLHLSSCKTENGFPQWLRDQRKLQMLWLSNSSIIGHLPKWLRKMPIIPILDLSHNKLSGPLTNLPDHGTSSIVESGSIKALLLQNNLFNESIPRSLCKKTYLEFLNLSRNKLRGKIPNCVENLQKLFTMILSSNRLSGVIPRSIASSSSSLVWLSLNDNNLIGKLPRELGNLQDLNVLDLGGNKLSGYIPEWTREEFASLMVFRLHDNNLTGIIPPSLCKRSGLRILDVAHNKLTGPIPHCLGELKAMANGSQRYLYIPEFEEYVIQVMKGVDLEYTNTLSLVFNLDLSSNNLVGEVPAEITSLSMLVGLNLSNNHLSGGIPNNIGSMKALNSLDLSGNDLTGMIPPSIAGLTFLSHLNLSNNNLTGRIPTGNQLQTLNDPSMYSGNKHLCGAPLKINCSNPEDPATTPMGNYKETDEPINKLWFYLDITSGFATGFWGIIIVLVFKKHWRHKLFMFAEVTIDKIYVAVVVRVLKMKRGREDA